MLTPQELQGRTFEKAIFGGYDMDGVDKFLETVTADYTSLFKENATLKNKLKVLVDKIEEYRSVDDVMRQMALKAQKESTEVIERAQKQAEELISSAHIAVSDHKRGIRSEIEREEARLDSVKRETIKFVSHLRELYTKEIELLAAIPSLPVDETPKSKRQNTAAAAAKDIDDSVQAEIAKNIESEVKPESAASPPPPPAESGGEEPLLPSEAKTYEVQFGSGGESDLSDIWKPEEDTVAPKPRTNFDDLEMEFGPNYKN
ncbi:MAG: DivIVA domain-containing protein [Oscillospiraceae bacterium]|nr:DivIVA domain-containing protein [Oscillospiraceae bacterium]